MAPDSNTLSGLPSANEASAIAGTRPLGLISRNHGSFCSVVEKLILRAVYGRPSSSRAIEILTPFGVCAVYNVIAGVEAIVWETVWRYAVGLVKCLVIWMSLLVVLWYIGRAIRWRARGEGFYIRYSSTAVQQYSNGGVFGFSPPIPPRFSA